MAQIWTGINEIMNLLIQHEFYREVLGDSRPGRLVEADAAEADADDEKVYEDEEMWTAITLNIGAGNVSSGWKDSDGVHF